MEKHLRHLPKIEKGKECLNCGHILVDDDNFCPRCGQINDIRRISFMDLIRETLGDFFAYDSRLQNSIIPLLTKPGQLSIDYIKGKRASHIHPIRLYFVVSFVFFMLSSINSWKNENVTVNNGLNNIEEVNKTGENKVTVSNNVISAETNSSNQDIYSMLNLADTLKVDEKLISRSKDSKFILFKLILIEIRANKDISRNALFKKYNLTDDTINNYVFSRAKEYSSFTIKKFAEKYADRFPLIAFFFLPFFVIFLNLFHFKQDILYLEHLIFAFHTQSVVFILKIFSEAISIVSFDIGNNIESIIIFLIFPIYLYIALKHFYNYKSHIKTLLMFIAINSTFIIMATAFLLVTLLSTFFIY